MKTLEEAIGKKKLGIDILNEHHTITAIEWFKDKGLDDFVTLDTYNDYGDLCFKYLDNEYKISFDKKDLSLDFNDQCVLRLYDCDEKVIDGEKHYVFDWNDHNTVQELRLYDWVEELPVIMENEINELKSKKTHSQIKKDQEQEELKLRYLQDVEENISLGKFSEPNSKDYKDYDSLKNKNNPSSSNSSGNAVEELEEMLKNLKPF